MTIARRFLAAESGEKGDKGGKGVGTAGFVPLSPFPPPSGKREAAPLLTGAEPWDRRAAVRLLLDADALVERLGIDGRHPAVRDAAAMVTSAFGTRDPETVRFAVAEFTALIRRLAAFGQVRHVCGGFASAAVGETH